MQGSRESSVWRTLAVAFGDGLAFGAGLTLTSQAVRTATPRMAPPHPDVGMPTARLAELEAQVKAGLEAGFTALDARTQELAGALEAQRRKTAEALERLRFEVAESQKEFARQVEERIDHTIGLRLQALQEETREAVREESLSAYVGFGNRVESLMDARFQGFR